MSQRQTTLPRCLVSPPRSARILSDIRYEVRHRIIPFLAELVTGLLLIGFVTIVVPLSLSALR